MLERADDSKLPFEGRCVALLWMHILVKLPFDLKRFDGGHQSNTVIDCVLSVIMPYLQMATPRTASARVLAQFLVRPDIKDQHLVKMIWLCLSVSLIIYLL